MDPADPHATGIGASFRRLGKRLVAVLANRLELFLVELQEEQGRVLRLLLLAVTMAVLGLMVLILASFALVVAFWDEARLTVLLGLTGLYAAGAVLAGWRLRRLLRSGNPFSATLGELKKDREWIDGQRQT